ncbi:MAG: hypothetical protein JXR73_14015 [Candidatus Omnitrophica bacterium]|nr:hypothetical protein [Candidatus Omnitrophota bacterium]
MRRSILNALFSDARPAPHLPTFRDWSALFALSILAAASAFLIGRFVLQDFPNSADEHAYLFQAQLFAGGRLSAPAHPKQEFLSPFFILTHGDKVFSLFPPGWPLLLSLGERAGCPALVNPLLSAGALFLIFALGWKLWGRREAWTAVLLTAISPFFLFNGASYFSHPSCLFSVLLAVYLLIVWERTEWFVWALLAGLAASWAFTIREFTAVLTLTAPLILTFAASKKRVRLLAGLLIGALPLLIFYLYYNQSLTGDWRMPARFLQSSERLGFGDREIQLFDYREIQHYGPVDAMSNLLRNLGKLVLWTAPGLPLFALLGAWRSRKQPWILALACSAALLPVGYILYPSDGGNQYGPRFYYESLGFLSLLAAPFIRDALHRRLAPNQRRAALAALLLAAAALFAMHGRFFHRQIYERRTLYRLVERRGLHNAVVFVSAPSGDMTQGDLIRNPADPRQADVVYAWHLAERNRELAQFFPDRSFFLFGRDPRTGAVFLQRLTL